MIIERVLIGFKAPFFPSRQAARRRFPIRTGRAGIEERGRSFFLDGIRQEARHSEYVSAESVTAVLQVLKSPAE
ncbi:MAG TPA: hypothetical protein VG324_21605, partial [Blastocatellia bacterium]|nr:hypothetical protein [Blastocatellia bacterium]